MRKTYAVATLAAALIAFTVSAPAQSPSVPIGVVVMHGKGGSPTKHVASLASALEQKGYLVANLEMPWSGSRQYDASVEAADKEVGAALDAMRAKGAKKVFVAGHSQGGLYALHYGAQHPVDGIIAIAPGGNVGNPIYRREVGSSVERARNLIAAGKGDEKAQFTDYEGSKGAFSVNVAPAIYLSWFDPDGAMNQVKSSKAIDPKLPVLFIAPKGDYPALQRVKAMMFGSLPGNPLTRMYEPRSSHLDAPSASVEEVVRWITDVASRPSN